MKKPTRRSQPARLRLEELESRLAPTGSLGIEESFDTTAVGKLPPGWSQWSSTGTNAIAVSSAQSLSPPNSLAISSLTVSGMNARAWVNTAQPANEQVSADVYLNSLIPVEILVRGSNLNTTTPSYYAVSVTQGLDLKLLKVTNGTVTTLGEVKSANWIANQWVNVTLFANGNNVRAQVQNTKTGAYLNSSGQWQSSQVWALNLSDTSISGGGEIGVGRLPSYTGTVYLDDFFYAPVTQESQPPTVTINSPLAGATVSGVVPIQVTATDNTSVTRVESYVDNVLRFVGTAAPYSWNFDTTEIGNGTHTLTVKAYDPAQNIGQSSVTFKTQNNLAPLSKPSIPQHVSDIRLMDLAYNGGASQLPPATIALLQSVVDLVVSDPIYASQITAVAPNTPQLLYSNVSSLYQSSLLNWLNYADANGDSREEAFYHVSQATPYTDGGGSTQPVNWFWGVYRGGSLLTDLTTQARVGGSIAFGGLGQSIYIGYPDRFWEINLALSSDAGNGWSGILEYPTAVDSSGNPTSWAPLNTLGNTTAGFTKSGQITFNPPADWKTASIDGSARMYYVRIRTTASGTAPVAHTILGDDYTSSNASKSGVIPAFDWALDTNHDGYLDPAQYAIAAAAGYKARFAYQSRLFSYGPMRFATNPGDTAFRAWAVQYEVQNLKNNPWASGLFMDNSTGTPPANSGSVIELTNTYSSDYGTLLYEIGRAIAPKWIMANTSGGGSNANPTVQLVQAYFEEFGIRALAQNYVQFENLAATVATRSTLATPAPYAVLDSTPQGGAPTDPRTELATLAYYYLLANPNLTFLDYDGGWDPSGPWSQHWFAAMSTNIGQPTGSWSLLASGADPSNHSLTYHIYQRSYTNALVLYKPLSYANGVTGTTANNTATTQSLGGLYYPLRADGTLGAPITSITLRNGEGAILIKTSTVATSFVVRTVVSSTQAGSALQVTVASVDVAGQVVPSFTGTVHFTSTDKAGVLPADYAFTAADKGVHTFNLNLKTAGNQTLTVTDSLAGLTGTASVSVTPAPASQFSIVAPASVNAQTPFSITVTAFDPFGNQVTNFLGTIRLTASGLLARLLAEYTCTIGDAGRHTFNGVILSQIATQILGVTHALSGILGSTKIQVEQWLGSPWTEWIFGT